uniref:Uncharacterized protein n=1 Tax=Setaria italica TaxID=4555 RepID=K3YFU3_SETIT
MATLECGISDGKFVYLRLISDSRADWILKWGEADLPCDLKRPLDRYFGQWSL